MNNSSISHSYFVRGDGGIIFLVVSLPLESILWYLGAVYVYRLDELYNFPGFSLISGIFAIMLISGFLGRYMPVGAILRSDSVTLIGFPYWTTVKRDELKLVMLRRGYYPNVRLLLIVPKRKWNWLEKWACIKLNPKIHFTKEARNQVIKSSGKIPDNFNETGLYLLSDAIPLKNMRFSYEYVEQMYEILKPEEK